MPKRKHVKKKVVTPCTDANQNVRESFKEKARVARAMAKKYEMLREQYLAEVKRKQEEEAKRDAQPNIISPTITPAPDRDVAND